MTDREFKNLRRSDLIEIIYEYQKREKELTEEIEELKKRLENAKSSENIAAVLRAVTVLNETIESAGKSTDLYIKKLNQINQNIEDSSRNISGKAYKKENCTGRQKHKKQ